MKPFYNEAHVTVDGEQLHLVCNFRAIDTIESLTGENMSAILPQLIDPPAALIGKMLWALLREKHEGVTLDEAFGVTVSPEAEAVGLVLGDLIRRSFNLGEIAKDENPPKRRGRSKTSSKNGSQQG